jgi:hypothetical protein
VTSPVPVLPEPIQTSITGNWTRVRPSFFRGLARVLEYAEDKCFGLILDSTVGYGRTWQKISWTRFCNVTAVTRRRCEQAISELLANGLIRCREAGVGNGKEYAIAARADGDVTGIAKCRGCGTVGEVDLDVDFIPVPHTFFVSLPAACDHGMYLVVKTVVERTMRWDKATKQIIVVPCEITIEEFERATGKKRAELCQDLAKVQAAGCEFIGSEKIGRTNRYWARPANFAKGTPRAAREVKQPDKKRNKGETTKTVKVVKVVETKDSIRPAEFVTAPCGVCRNCQCYGPMDIVSVVEKKPVEQARAGPKQKTAYQKAQDDAFEKIMGVKRA